MAIRAKNPLNSRTLLKEKELSQKQILEAYRKPENFLRLIWQEDGYPWQIECLRALGPRGSRVALAAANGSGKTSKVTAAAIMWHMMIYQGSQTVVTAGVYRQLTDILWPVLRNKALAMGGESIGWRVTESHITYSRPDMEPSLCTAFSATDPGKAEGWHGRGPSNNLLYVIDEAKSVDDTIFEAMERCQPTRVLIVSSPGGQAGTFFRIFSKPDPRYKTFKVTSFDCPHISQEWIDSQVAEHGEKSALVQSMIYAEFGADDGSSLILPISVLQKALSSQPAKDDKGTLYAGCDFAAGGDENVIVFRKGNCVKEIISWREKDTMAGVGRFITEFKRSGIKPEHIYADAGGLGIPMCDALREAGIEVNRVNNGETASTSEKFANRGTEMWVRFARMVETGKVVLPDDPVLHRQLTNRRLLHNSKGKLMAEPKPNMAQRGAGSPDRADALILAFRGMGASQEEFQKQYGRQVSFQELHDEVFGDEEARKGTIAGAFAG